MTIVRTGKLICITIEALALFLPWTSQAGDPPHPASAPVAIPDSTPSGKRDPYCPNFLQRLRTSLVRAMDDSTAVKLETLPPARPGSLRKFSQNARDKILDRIKVHFYNSQPIEILDSAIDLKTSYVAIDKSGLYAGKVDNLLSNQYAAEIEATIKSAETYPARWKELMDIEAQSQMRLEQLEKKFEAIKSGRVQQKQWLKALGSERDKLGRTPSGHPVEIELPLFNEKGEFQSSSHRVKFESVAAARKAISDAEGKLVKGIEFNGPYWLELPAVRGRDIFPVPNTYSFGTTADLEVAIKKFKRLIETLQGNYKTEGSYLNTAAGQVVNLKQLETIRNVLRDQRQNLQNDGIALADDAKTYFDSQISRIDAIIDPMNRPKDGFDPPQIAFQKVRTKRLFKEFLGLPKSIKDDINKPIKSRKQWDNMGGGVIDSTTNGHPDQPGLKLGVTDGSNPTSPQAPQQLPDPTAPANPGWTPGGQTSWFAADVGTAGQITPATGGTFSRFKEKVTPLTSKYDALMAKIAAIDPAVVEAYGQSKNTMKLALWRGGKIVTYLGAASGLAYNFTPKSVFDFILTLREKSDDEQMQICATQGAKQVGDLYVNSDPNQNSSSDQQFQDCSIAFIKTKFVKDYLAELSKDDGTVATHKEADSIEIDPSKIATKPTKGKFFRNKKTGEIYVRPEFSSMGLVKQPGVSFDPQLQLMKINLSQIPTAEGDGPQHIVEKNPTTGNLMFHVDQLASSDSGLYFLNSKHEIVLSSKINNYVNTLLQKRRKVMGYRNNQSNVESVLRQFLTNANPCSDPAYTRWMTSNSKDEFRAGLLSCVRFLYPGFMRLGDTEARVNELLNADAKNQPDLLKPLVTMDATFGNYVCSLVAQRAYFTDPAAATSMLSPFNCQNLSTYAGTTGAGWPMGTPPWGAGLPGSWNPGGGWSGVTTGTTAGAGTTTQTTSAPTGNANQTQAPGNTAPGVPNYIPGLSGPPNPNQTGSPYFLY